MVACASSSKSSSSSNTSSSPTAGQPDNADLPVTATASDPVAADVVATAESTTASATSTASSAVKSEPALVDYTVVSGDSLWKIARQFGTSVAKLKKINGLTTDHLSIGQKLKVPQK
jgi:peptidoglycan endopeptidase LytE